MERRTIQASSEEHSGQGVKSTAVGAKNSVEMGL